ncbi:MAG: RND family transporter [Proteobacteria bacterium]|nr:RND family transporter [Pseudomonadota bacterium]
MKSLLNTLNTFFEHSHDRLIRHRLKIWLGFILLFGVSVLGIPRLSIDMTMESFFEENDPVKLLYDQFRDTFGSDDSVYIVYEAADGDIFSDRSLRALQRLQDLLENPEAGENGDVPPTYDHIVEVKTLLNVSYLEADQDTLISREFIGDELPATDAEREKLRQQALHHDDYPQFYLSRDSRYGGILIRTDFGIVPIDEGPTGEEDDLTDDGFDATIPSQPPGKQRYKLTTMQEYADFDTMIEELIGRPEFEGTLKFYPVGNPAIMGFFNDVFNTEISILFSGALVLMMIVLFVLFRSVSGIVWPVCVVILSLFITLGLAGWLDVTMSMMVQILMMLVMVVGIADSVHILSGYYYFRHRNLEHLPAIRAVLRRSGLACLLTSVTTSIGMFALTIVPIRPIQVFGLFAGFGVLLAFVVSVVLLPLMLDIWQPISRKRAQRIAQSLQKPSFVQRFLGAVEPYSYQYPKTILLVFIVVLGIALYGVSQVKIDSNMVEIIEEGLPIRVAHDLVDDAMGGSQSMEIYLKFGKQDALKDPEVLNAMEKIQSTLKTKHGQYVVKTSSLVNVVKESYRSLNENRQEMYIIPQNRRVLEQTLLMFDMANPDDRSLLVPDDYSQGRISVRLINYGSSEYTDFFEDINNQLQAVFDPLKQKYPDLEVDITGNLAMMMIMIEYISWSQIRSFGLALAIITVLLFVVFGSPKVGLIAMIPNVFPVLVTFGTMGLFGFALDADTLIIAPIVIGIAVDDTIHFLTHYRSEYMETGNTVKSIVLSLREAGQAITFSTVILVIGFSILVISVHQGMANFGILSAVAFCSALLADFLLLPSLCVLFKIKFPKRRPA